MPPKTRVGAAAQPKAQHSLVGRLTYFVLQDVAFAVYLPEKFITIGQLMYKGNHWYCNVDMFEWLVKAMKIARAYKSDTKGKRTVVVGPPELPEFPPCQFTPTYHSLIQICRKSAIPPEISSLQQLGHVPLKGHEHLLIPLDPLPSFFDDRPSENSANAQSPFVTRSSRNKNTQSPVAKDLIDQVGRLPPASESRPIRQPVVPSIYNQIPMTCGRPNRKLLPDEDSVEARPILPPPFSARPSNRMEMPMMSMPKPPLKKTFTRKNPEDKNKGFSTLVDPSDFAKVPTTNQEIPPSVSDTEVESLSDPVVLITAPDMAMNAGTTPQSSRCMTFPENKERVLSAHWYESEDSDIDIENITDENIPGQAGLSESFQNMSLDGTDCNYANVSVKDIAKPEHVSDTQNVPPQNLHRIATSTPLREKRSEQISQVTEDIEQLNIQVNDRTNTASNENFVIEDEQFKIQNPTEAVNIPVTSCMFYEECAVDGLVPRVQGKKIPFILPDPENQGSVQDMKLMNTGSTDMIGCLIVDSGNTKHFKLFMPLGCKIAAVHRDQALAKELFNMSAETLFKDFPKTVYHDEKVCENLRKLHSESKKRKYMLLSELPSDAQIAELTGKDTKYEIPLTLLEPYALFKEKAVSVRTELQRSTAIGRANFNEKMSLSEMILTALHIMDRKKNNAVLKIITAAMRATKYVQFSLTPEGKMMHNSASRVIRCFLHIFMNNCVNTDVMTVLAYRRAYFRICSVLGRMLSRRLVDYSDVDFAVFTKNSTTELITGDMIGKDIIDDNLDVVKFLSPLVSNKKIEIRQIDGKSSIPDLTHGWRTPNDDLVDGLADDVTSHVKWLQRDSVMRVARDLRPLWPDESNMDQLLQEPEQLEGNVDSFSDKNDQSQDEDFQVPSQDGQRLDESEENDVISELEDNDEEDLPAVPPVIGLKKHPKDSQPSVKPRSLDEILREQIEPPAEAVVPKPKRKVPRNPKFDFSGQHKKTTAEYTDDKDDEVEELEDLVDVKMEEPEAEITEMKAVPKSVPVKRKKKEDSQNRIKAQAQGKTAQCSSNTERHTAASRKEPPVAVVRRKTGNISTSIERRETVKQVKVPSRAHIGVQRVQQPIARKPNPKNPDLNKNQQATQTATKKAAQKSNLKKTSIETTNVKAELKNPKQEWDESEVYSVDRKPAVKQQLTEEEASTTEDLPEDSSIEVLSNSEDNTDALQDIKPMKIEVSSYSPRNKEESPRDKNVTVSKRVKNRIGQLQKQMRQSAIRNTNMGRKRSGSLSLQKSVVPKRLKVKESSPADLQKENFDTYFSANRQFRTAKRMTESKKVKSEDSYDPEEDTDCGSDSDTDVRKRNKQNKPEKQNNNSDWVSANEIHRRKKRSESSRKPTYQPKEEYFEYQSQEEDSEVDVDNLQGWEDLVKEEDLQHSEAAAFPQRRRTSRPSNVQGTSKKRQSRGEQKMEHALKGINPKLSAWTEDEKLGFLDLYATFTHKGKGPFSKWVVFSVEFKNNGFDKTNEQCRKQEKFMKDKYKTLVNTTGRGGKMSYLDQRIIEVMGARMQIEESLKVAARGSVETTQRNLVSARRQKIQSARSRAVRTVHHAALRRKVSPYSKESYDQDVTTDSDTWSALSAQSPYVPKYRKPAKAKVGEDKFDEKTDKHIELNQQFLKAFTNFTEKIQPSQKADTDSESSVEQKVMKKKRKRKH